jgi:2-iminobutanoate/2-iminopropanoate deaminase
MNRERISTDKAPAAVGPYSQAIQVGHLIFTAGQIALDPATGQLAHDDIQGQTGQVMKNLQAILETAGTDLKNVVKTTVFLQDMNHFAAMNEVYGQHFGQEPPARSTVEVAKLPLNALVEIEVVALIPMSD